MLIDPCFSNLETVHDCRLSSVNMDKAFDPEQQCLLEVVTIHMEKIFDVEKFHIFWICRSGKWPASFQKAKNSEYVAHLKLFYANSQQMLHFCKLP